MSELVDNIKIKTHLDSLLAVTDNIVIFLSPEKIISEFSKNAEKILGWKRKDIIGAKMDYVCTNAPLPPPLTLNEFSKILNKHKKYIDKIIILKNGNNITIRWTITELNRLVPSGSGYIIIGKNITDKNDDETGLKLNSYQLEKIAACVPGNFYWKNIKLEYLGCNQSLLAMLGLSTINEIVGKTDYDLWPEQANEIRKHDFMVMETEKTSFLEETVVMPEKDIMYFTVIKMPLFDSNGKIIGILGNSLDITELKNTQINLKIAKEAAEAASIAKTEFIANMSHDIRTPLTGVIGMSEILESSLEDAQQKEQAHMIHEGGEELLSMLNGILDDIKAGNTNETNLHAETFDLYECINNLIKLERPTTTAKNLGLVVDIAPTVPRYIINDRKKIHRILLNLLGNAIKFTPSGQITVQVKCLECTDKADSDVKLRFSVIDTGIGIPADKQDKVFDRFFRVTPSYKGLYKGHGLGLHIAQSYAKLLGGEIALISEEGVGSTFYFDIQCQIAEVIEDSIPAETPSIEPVASSSLTSVPYFLLVEDNLMALKVLQSMVSKAGCRYESVMNGEDALELLKTTRFDMVLTDIGLKGISGTELTSRIRAWEDEHGKPHLPIIGLTGHARETALADCLQTGMNDVYTKPANLALIKSLIQTFILDKGTLDPIQKNQTPSVTPSALGKDLPNTEAELFQLQKYALFDPKIALEQTNDLSLLFDILKAFLSEEGQEDILCMKKAYESKDWAKIESLAHKLKGGALYMGTCRLQYACQYFERYYKANHRVLLEELYQQLQEVYADTTKEVKAWLMKYNKTGFLA